MKDMRILSHDGRIVAVNKSGKWEPLHGATEYDISRAIQEGVVEVLHPTEVLDSPLIDFAMVASVCLITLLLAVTIFGQ